MKLTLQINDTTHSLDVAPMRRLLDVLRQDLRLTGTKEGCGEGECGACTVLIDGIPANACLVPVAQVQGQRVETIEAEAAETLSDVQQALLDGGAAQCGICTPGIVLCARAALRDEPNANAHRLRVLLAGNLCRCTGYQRIVDALLPLMHQRRERAQS